MYFAQSSRSYTSASFVMSHDVLPMIRRSRIWKTESHFESKAESEVTFLNFCHELQIDIQQSDIAACHRLPKSARTKYAPLLIRFTNRKILSRVLGARKQLRETKKEVYINEHLTKTASDIFAADRRLQKDRKILQTWTTNGKVMVKLLDNKTRPIFSKSDLAHL